jgi:RES domain-containing protein
VTEVYRLVKTERADHTLSGEGARLYGGRWNPPGISVVYASESRALAVLEAFVQLALEARAMRFLLCAITLPRRARLKHHRVERHLRTLAATQEAGRAWIDGGTALALVVPSVIVPQEQNYVLNVRHPQFAQLHITESEPFSFDERLWQSRGASAG